MLKVINPFRILQIFFLYSFIYSIAFANDVGSVPVENSYGVVLFFAMVLLAIIISLAVYTDIVRDVDPHDFGGALSEQGKPLRRPYSLARVQMAFWFLLVLVAYIFLYQLDGSYNTITPQTLLLMGISGGTALGAGLVENNKTNSALQALQDQNAKIADFRAQGIPEQSLEKLVKDRDMLARQLAAKNFFTDILTDSNGITLHRFQMMIWTVVLGGVFIIQLLTEHKMPKFEPITLAVLGISVTTYLGFKIPE